MKKQKQKRSKRGAGRPSLLVVGALPPPANGMTLSTELVLGSELSRTFEVSHLDTSDHRDISNIARVDFRNVFLAFKHGMQFAYLLLRRRPRVVYLPVARNRVGFLRD